MRIELIAHRAGNDPRDVAAAAAIADAVEIDVHLARGRLEARHAKRLLGTGLLWDRWFLLPRATARVDVVAVLEACAPDAPLLIDLKGWSPRAARMVRDVLGGRPNVTVSTKAWWLLRPFRSAAATLAVRSAGNRLELFALRRLGHRWRGGAAVRESLLTERTVRELRARGPLLTWGVTEAGRARELRDWGVDGLIIDDLGLIAELRSGGV